MKTLSGITLILDDVLIAADCFASPLMSAICAMVVTLHRFLTNIYTERHKVVI